MNVKIVRAYVNGMKKMVRNEIINLDPQMHIFEDKLHQDVLKAIANGAENPEKLAKEALKTFDIKFSRWYE